ncbi:MAG: hypothetical protein AB1Z98_16270 [Nannocystaceae bacterium]
MTGTKASTKAARTLTMSEDEEARSAAASALAQVGSPDSTTSAEVASTAGKVLSDPESSARAKSAAASALAQRVPAED